jgi:hypothetical protein
VRVAGLDLSLALTGYAIFDTAWARPYVDTIRTEPLPNRVALPWTHKRMRSIVAGLRADLLPPYDGSEMSSHAPLDLVALERPTPGSQGHQHDRSGLHWLVEDILISAGVPCVEISPATAKLYLTNDGHASKGEMLRAARLRLPGVDVVDDNAADALALCAMAARHLGHPLPGDDQPLSAKQLKSWNGIPWPERT